MLGSNQWKKLISLNPNLYTLNIFFNWHGTQGQRQYFERDALSQWHLTTPKTSLILTETFPFFQYFGLLRSLFVDFFIHIFVYSIINFQGHLAVHSIAKWTHSGCEGDLHWTPSTKPIEIRWLTKDKKSGIVGLYRKAGDTKSGFSADMPICILKNLNLFETVASCIKVTSVKSLATSCSLSSIAQSRFFVVGFMPAGQALSLLEPNEINLKQNFFKRSTSVTHHRCRHEFHQTRNLPETVRRL